MFENWNLLEDKQNKYFEEINFTLKQPPNSINTIYSTDISYVTLDHEDNYKVNPSFFYYVIEGSLSVIDMGPEFEKNNLKEQNQDQKQNTHASLNKIPLVREMTRESIRKISGDNLNSSIKFTPKKNFKIDAVEIPNPSNDKQESDKKDVEAPSTYNNPPNLSIQANTDKKPVSSIYENLIERYEYFVIPNKDVGQKKRDKANNNCSFRGKSAMAGTSVIILVIDLDTVMVKIKAIRSETKEQIQLCNSIIDNLYFFANIRNSMNNDVWRYNLESKHVSKGQIVIKPDKLVSCLYVIKSGSFLLQKAQPFYNLYENPGGVHPKLQDNTKNSVVYLKISRFGEMDCQSPFTFKNKKSEYYLTCDSSVGHIVWLNFNYQTLTCPDAVVKSIKQFSRNQKRFIEHRCAFLTKKHRHIYPIGGIPKRKWEEFVTIKDLEKREDYTGGHSNNGISMDKAAIMRDRIMHGIFREHASKKEILSGVGNRLFKFFDKKFHDVEKPYSPTLNKEYSTQGKILKGRDLWDSFDLSKLSPMKATDKKSDDNKLDSDRSRVNSDNNASLFMKEITEEQEEENKTKANLRQPTLNNPSYSFIVIETPTKMAMSVNQQLDNQRGVTNNDIISKSSGKESVDMRSVNEAEMKKNCLSVDDNNAKERGSGQSTPKLRIKGIETPTPVFGNIPRYSHVEMPNLDIQEMNDCKFRRTGGFTTMEKGSGNYFYPKDPKNPKQKGQGFADRIDIMNKRKNVSFSTFSANMLRVNMMQQIKPRSFSVTNNTVVGNKLTLPKDCHMEKKESEEGITNENQEQIDRKKLFVNTVRLGLPKLFIKKAKEYDELQSRNKKMMEVTLAEITRIKKAKMIENLKSDTQNTNLKIRAAHLFKNTLVSDEKKGHVQNIFRERSKLESENEFVCKLNKKKKALHFDKIHYKLVGQTHLDKLEKINNTITSKYRRLNKSVGNDDRY